MEREKMKKAEQANRERRATDREVNRRR